MAISRVRRTYVDGVHNARSLVHSWNCGGLTEDGGLIQSEEGRGLFIRIGLGVRMYFDGERKSDGRGRTVVQEQVRQERDGRISRWY